MFNLFPTFGGMPITVSPHATEVRPRFPDKKWSKRRRRRVIGKYGSWTYRVPAALRLGNRLIVHPAIYNQLRKELA
ncbi:hypothetical protein SAMN05216376_111160 [Mameliella alba]|uniref:hypothetical protein n=1 Tax=Mameliella alba TaxID=561184 RepID=UPI00088A2F4E|nr:hypothetical protein [Mameliella alba]OWV46457.1 hypothetical protein CDZ96_17745 [Mameliella alba]PTR37264.1 hypothetical protein LX94_03603 [Mameliella alba]GGF73343.1 hypothetical protein GCM10011319_37350 [Mameliella alba]SDD77613.1 hypothetical protein SAMN05216376_111160 [Mameliella alba]